MNDTRIWTVELEPGVWVASLLGDPGRTLVRKNAKEFASRKEARAALIAARKYRPFAQAVISEQSQRMGASDAKELTS